MMGGVLDKLEDPDVLGQSLHVAALGRDLIYLIVTNLSKVTHTCLTK